MGAKLVAFFDKAKEKGGLESQMKLAMLVKMSLSKASAAPDTPENEKVFDAAFKKL